MIFFQYITSLFIAYNVLKIYDYSTSIKRIKGNDERTIDNSETDIKLIKEYFKKYDLINLLERSDIGTNRKIELIKESDFFDDINKITQPNLSKGLEW